MGPTMGKIEGVLPNAGVGLRIEVQPRMNVRLDFGRNFANDQSLFYFNMTEAFLMEVNTMQTEYILKAMDAALAAGKEILNVYNDPSSDFRLKGKLIILH